MVSRSQPAARRSAMAWLISSRCSPRPRMRFDLVIRPACLAADSTASERSYRNPGLIRRNTRGTVSMLWASVSGRASNTCLSNSGLPSKSGISSSTPQPGTTSWISAQVCAYSQAPPSARSSLATPVTVAYRSPIAWTDSATRRGSSVSSGAGLPVSIWQKSHRLVHWSPPIRKVASRSSQHSKMLGQPACSQTVCRFSRRTRSFSSLYCGPVRSRVLIQAGLRSIGVWLLRASSRSIRRPSGASTTPPDYGPTQGDQAGVGSAAEHVCDRGGGRAGARVGQAVSLLDRAQHVVVVDFLAVPAGLDVRTGEDRGDVVACCLVVGVPGQDQQAVVRRRPGDVAADVVLQPGVAHGDRRAVHVVDQVGIDERDGGQAAIAGRR